MAIKRQLIGISLLGLSVVGVSLATIPFVRSWSVTDRARAGAVLVEIGDLKPGKWKAADGRGARFFVVRQLSGKISVLLVPLRDGLVEMPDMHWWHPGYDCPDFGLSEFNGQVTDASRFECRVIDAQVAWAKPYWTWNSEGRTAGGANDFFDDMPTVSYELHNDILLIKWPL